MKFLTMQKKMEILEHAFAESAGAYYNINLSKNRVPGTMYQMLNGKQYSLNEKMGLPENARFSDVAAFWGERLRASEQPAYFEFLSCSNLLKAFQAGKRHVFHRYWSHSISGEPMLVEHHIVMYQDEVSGDIMAIAYILDLTRKHKEEQYKWELEEKQMRLEAALRRVKEASKYQEMQVALEAVDNILQNITALDNVESEAELNDILPTLLASMGTYSMSARAYIFSWASEERHVLCMTHEWCAAGVTSTIDKMQCLKLSDLPNWMPRLCRGEAIISMDWEAERDKTPEEFAVFDGQDIRSLIIIPIFSSRRVNGYIGFDNPEQSMTALSVRLLSSVGAYIGGVKENLFMMNELERKQQSLQDSLDKLNEERNILNALCIDYISVHYCDLQADTMVAIKQEDYTNAAIAEKHMDEQQAQTYSYRIRYYFENFIIQESAPDFLYKMSAAYLKDYLTYNERFAYRFRAKPNQVGQQYFEVQVVRLTGASGFKVVIGYRYVDDIIAEQEKQKIKLENALAEATLNSEIIDSISKVYWLIYRMDLKTGTYEEISAGSEVHHLTGKRGKTAEMLKEMRETVVGKEHQSTMERFLDTSTLTERLRDIESIAAEYQAVGGSWHLARFIVKKREQNGCVSNVLYVVRQIDKQKQLEVEYKQKLLETAEDARRANIAKTDFLRRMSHDIRTPINGIRGMVTVAEHYGDDLAKQKECRDKIKEASGFLLDLVNNILDMNKLESGSVVLEHKPFEMLQLLNETYNITSMNADIKGISVSFDYTKIQHTHLLGSPLHLKQALQNVVGNAVKYNHTGGSIRLSAEELSCADDKVTYRFICTDTGCGMSEEFIQHAFEPFAQEDSSARTSYMGTGLGLAIVKQLIEMMGGTVQVQSQLQVGTTFCIDMPFDLAADFAQEERTEQFIPDDVLRGVHVLLVEDNDLNLEIAKFMLENAGMRVTSAQNGQQAVDLFAASPEYDFGLILMDVMMPIMDGLTATRTIRRMARQDAASVPILAMTANAFAEDREQSQAAGMNEHLSKPLDEHKMMQIIKRYIRNQRVSQ